MKRISSIVLVTAALSTVALTVLSDGAFSDRANKLPVTLVQNEGEKITATARPSSGIWHMEWRIDQPNVKKRMTLYPQIGFHTGDRVGVRAAGCVQTGGHGQTWKRYLDPSGPNSDHLYHGLIWIPGTIGGPETSAPDLKRIAGYTNHTLVIRSPTYLRLGYEDDDYSTNGYWGHDDGTGDQCKGIGNAFVTVTIERVLPRGSQVNRADLSQASPGFEFARFFANGTAAANVREFGSGGVTGRYNCTCINNSGTCTLNIAGGAGAISCGSGPASSYQSPSVPYCTSSCILVPTAN